jgi:hypothetical protein
VSKPSSGPPRRHEAFFREAKDDHRLLRSAHRQRGLPGSLAGSGGEGVLGGLEVQQCGGAVGAIQFVAPDRLPFVHQAQAPAAGRVVSHLERDGGSGDDPNFRGLQAVGEDVLHLGGEAGFPIRVGDLDIQIEPLSR